MSMMNKGLKTVAALALSASMAAAATAPIYVNHGYVTDAPQIDAAAFFNDGIFDIFTSLPFSTLNTVNYTNRGGLYGQPGWRFDYATLGARVPANNIVNNGIIESSDFGGFTVIIGDNGLNQVVAGGSATVSHLLLSATNVTSTGLMTVGSGGLLKIDAKNVKLNRSGVRSGPSPSGFNTGNSDLVIGQGTNYINAPEIQDVYWGVGTNQALAQNRERPINLFNFNPITGFAFGVPFPRSPVHEVQNQLANSNVFFNAQAPSSLDTNRYSAFVYTTTPNATSVVIQVAYVATNLNSGEVTSTVRWAPGQNNAYIPIVQIGSRAFDTALNNYFTNYVFVSDDMLTRSNIFLSLNLDVAAARPVNYRVSTTAPFNWFGAEASNKDFQYFQDIFNPLWLSPIVTNSYTGYSFLVNRAAVNSFNNLFIGLPSRGFTLGNPFTPDFFDPTNRQGRIEINASESLDLSRTRVRAEQYTQIKSPNTVFDSNTIFDSPFLSLDVGNPAGAFKLENTVPATVDRISGQINCYSARWTNIFVQFDFSDPNNVQSNVTVINQHVFIVDNATIESTVDVSVMEVMVKSPDVTLADPMQIVRGLRLDSTNVTLAAPEPGINLLTELVDIGPTNLLGTVSLTNSGSFYNFGNTRLGLAANDPLATLRNSGLWYSLSQEIDVDHFVNDGTMYAAGGAMYLSGRHGDLQTGSLLVNSDVHLSFDELDSGFSAVSAGFIDVVNGIELLYPGKIYIDVADEIRDGGEFQLAPISTWDSTDGFAMLEKPLLGDFHGTRFVSYGYQFGEVIHQWAGEDLGLTDEGYVNNAAIGELVLDGDILSQFTFDTVDGNNAIYVEYLNLRNYATNATEAINIKPGMKIYFTRASVPLARLANIPGLVYLPVSTAPAMTTVALANGFSYTAKNNLLFSDVLDSDADGIANAVDATPFDEARITVEYINEPAPFARIVWHAAPLTEYILQYKDDVSDSGWKELNRTMTYSEYRTISIKDTGAQPGQRYYRVIYNP